MARRKDHSPEDLRALLRSAAAKIIANVGVDALSVRAVAIAVGYSPGTIYNLYYDLDALILDVNHTTLGRLQEAALERLRVVPKGLRRITTLAHLYLDFAEENKHLWQALFIARNKTQGRHKLPNWYRERLTEIFSMSENALRESLVISEAEARFLARMLWASIHGITALVLDGRLALVGIDNPYKMIDRLVKTSLAAYATR